MPRLQFFTLTLVCATWGVVAAAVAQPEALREITRAAAAAQTKCHGKIHHDTYEFEHCILDMSKQAAQVDASRLGADYFGYVGAMNSARMGMLGAQETAQVFLLRFRQTQKRMRLGDLALCETIPGDCDVRIATMRFMERQRPKRSTRQRDESEEQQHVH